MADSTKILKTLLADFESKSVTNYDSLTTTISAVIKIVFGDESEYTKKAAGLESGWDVEGALASVNGMYPNDKYERNRYEAYRSLLKEAINAVELYGLGL